MFVFFSLRKVHLIIICDFLLIVCEKTFQKQKIRLEKTYWPGRIYIYTIYTNTLYVFRRANSLEWRRTNLHRHFIIMYRSFLICFYIRRSFFHFVTLFPRCGTRDDVFPQHPRVYTPIYIYTYIRARSELFFILKEKNKHTVYIQYIRLSNIGVWHVDVLMQSYRRPSLSGKIYKNIYSPRTFLNDVNLLWFFCVFFFFINHTFPQPKFRNARTRVVYRCVRYRKSRLR